ELGFRYFGPIDGHNIAQLVQTFEIVKTLRGPRVVHVITEKGRGFPLPEPDLEKYHARAPYDPITGKLKPVNPGPPQWTGVRRRNHAPRRREPEFRDDYGRDAIGHGHQYFREEVAGAFFRRGDRRGACDHLCRRARDAGRPADRRDL